METNDWILKRIPAHLRPSFVIGAGILLQFTYGIVYTFGNILPYLASYLRWHVDPHQTTGSLVWLQSLMGGLPFAMVTGGYLERKIGARLTVLLGSTIYSGSLALSYFSIQHSYLLLVVTFGVMCSFGGGISYNAVLICSQRWLPHRVGFASGLITAGFALGASIISPLQTKFINPDNLHVNSQGYFTQVELLERVPQMFLLLAGMFSLLQFLALFFIAEPIRPITNVATTTEEEGEPRRASLLLAAEVSGGVMVGVDVEDEEEQEETVEQSAATAAETESHPLLHRPKLSYHDIFTSDTFLICFFTLLLNGIWIQTSSGLFKAYGQTFIHDDMFLATTNSFAAATNCVSRILWGLIADRTSYQASMSFACAMGAALMWSLGAVRIIEDQWVYFIWICLMFSSTGATYSLMPYAAATCFGARRFGISYGFMQLSLTISGIITALLSQFLLPAIGYQSMFLLVGSTMCISFGLTTLIGRSKYGSRPEN